MSPWCRRFFAPGAASIIHRAGIQAIPPFAGEANDTIDSDNDNLVLAKAGLLNGFASLGQEEDPVEKGKPCAAAWV